MAEPFNPFADTPSVAAPTSALNPFANTPADTGVFNPFADTPTQPNKAAAPPVESNPVVDFVKGIPEATGKFIQETIGGGINTAKYIAHDIDTFSTLPHAVGPANGLWSLSQEFRKAIGVPVSQDERKALATDIVAYQKSNNVDPKLVAHLNELMADQPTVEERKATNRGLATITQMVAEASLFPVAATGAVAKRLVPAVILRKAAAAEAHGIASMVTWGAGQNIANQEPIQKDLLQNAATGALLPPVGAILGKSIGLGFQGVGKTLGAVAAVGRGMENIALKRIKGYVATRQALANFTDYVVLNGEQVLRKNGLHTVADQLMSGRIAQNVQGAQWISTLGQSLGDLSKEDQTLIGQMLHEDIAPGVLAKLTKTDPALLASRAKEVRTLVSTVGDLQEQAGIPIFDPRDGSIHRFVKRADFGMPHMYVNTVRFVTEGDPLRNDAIAALRKSQGWTQAKAESWLKGLHARNIGEVEDVMQQGKSRIRGSVTSLGRRFSLPGYEENPAQVLPKYFMDTARKLDNINRFGNPKTPRPFTYETDAASKVMAHTDLHGGGTFNLDPSLSQVRTHGFAVALAGKAVPAGELSAAHIEEVAVMAQDFRIKYPGMKITLGTWRDGNDIHIEVGALMPNRQSAMALGNVSKRQSIARLGRGGVLQNIIKIEANKDAVNLTADEAHAILKDWHQTKVGEPFSKPKALPTVLNVKTLFPGAFDQLEGINSNWQRDMAEGVIARSLGYEHGDIIDVQMKATINAALGFQAINKLGLSQISQFSQMLTPIAIAGFKNSWRDFLTLMKSDPAMQDRIVRSGAILPALVRASEASMGATTTGAEKALKLTGFTWADTFARKYAVIRGWTTASHLAEQMTELGNRLNVIGPGIEQTLTKKSLAKIEKAMIERGLDPAAIVKRGGVLTEEDFARGGLKMSTDANFWGDALSLSPAFSNTWGKVLTQFKSFVFQQGEFNRKYIIDPALRDGNWAPLAKMLPVAVVGGEAINDIKSFLRNRPRREQTRLLDDLLSGISLGWMGDTMINATDEQKMYSNIVGPTVSDGVDLFSGAVSAGHGDLKPLAKKAVQVLVPRIPVVGPIMTSAVTNTLFPPRQKAAP